MQAVILAAGRGTRMEPLSTITPKPMLPVADRPLLAHVADAAVAAGASELVFVVGYKGDHVRSYFGDSYGGVPVRYAVQSAPSGTADAVRAASHLLSGEFAVLNGDNVFDTESIVSLFSHDAAVATHRVDDAREYGVVSTDGEYATDIVEKPDDPPSNLANAGAYVFPASFTSALDVPKSERGEREITDVLARLLDERDVVPVETERWIDVARPADLVRANETVLADRTARVDGSVSPDATIDGVVQVDANASVAANATIRGPVVLGHDVTVEAGAELRGPTVVGANATVGRDAHLDRVIVLPGGRVDADVRLRNLVLGPQCEISVGARVAGADDAPNHTSSIVSAVPSLDGGLPY